MRTAEFKNEIERVRIMLNTSEKISSAENYVTSLYANEKITSRQFELLCGMIYG